MQPQHGFPGKHCVSQNCGNKKKQEVAFWSSDCLSCIKEEAYVMEIVMEISENSDLHLLGTTESKAINE